MPADYKIIVTNSDPSIRLLQYINDQIEAIVFATGCFVKIEKIDKKDLDDEKLAALKKRGISALPVAVSPSGKVIPGTASVIKLFSGKIRAATSGKGGDDGGYVARDMGNDPQLSNFYAREMFEIKNGVLEKRTDAEDEMGDNAKGEIEKKMRSFQRPSHYDQPSGKSKHSKRPAPREESSEDEYSMEENVAQPHSNEHLQTGGTDMDSRMMDAWLTNNS
jgi:hypothetical protein